MCQWLGTSPEGARRGRGRALKARTRSGREGELIFDAMDCRESLDLFQSGAESGCV
jgi:hypothetical protein